MLALHQLAKSYFTNLNHITRDRSHRARSVQKGCWSLFDDVCSGLLGALLTDEQSLSRMLQSSDKYSRLFLECSRDTEGFARQVQNFSFALQRMDSLSLPLLKIFHLLPAVYKFLTSLTAQGDSDDQRWAIALLTRLTGTSAYMSIMRAALAADAMLVGLRFLRWDDVAESNPVLKASEAACLQMSLRLLYVTTFLKVSFCS